MKRQKIKFTDTCYPRRGILRERFPFGGVLCGESLEIPAWERFSEFYVWNKIRFILQIPAWNEFSMKKMTWRLHDKKMKKMDRVQNSCDCTLRRVKNRQEFGWQFLKERWAHSKRAAHASVPVWSTERFGLTGILAYAALALFMFVKLRRTAIL